MWQIHTGFILQLVVYVLLAEVDMADRTIAALAFPEDVSHSVNTDRFTYCVLHH